MKIVAILTVRDEEDIIEDSLRHFLEWADKVVVFDTGSVDETWKRLLAIRASEKRVHAVRKDVYFTDAIRSYSLQMAKDFLRDGDWVARVDADERYHINPRDFIVDNARSFHDSIYGRYYTFEYTTNDWCKWITGEESLHSRLIPIDKRRRIFFKHQLELRLFRWSHHTKWPSNSLNPLLENIPVDICLPIRHYPARDPVQLFRRQVIRNEMASSDTFKAIHPNVDIHHWRRTWDSYIFPIEQMSPQHSIWEEDSEFLWDQEDRISPRNSLLRRIVRKFRYRTRCLLERSNQDESLISLPNSVMERIRDQSSWENLPLEIRQLEI